MNNGDSGKTVPPSDRTRGYGFGTFKGVYTPSILTILGVIMYLRFGWVLGNVGLSKTLLIVTMASSITFLTGLSISALATNMRVGGGGAYFMISRSLGIETGAAIGVPLFFAQALGISFYISGFSESVAGVFTGWDPKIIGMATLVVLTLLAFRSADLALKTQFIILALIAASLVSFFTGGSPGLPAAPEGVPVLPSVPFWVVFAVFFPAVTGIEAGIAMSGDLKNPARSLPLGTLGAVLTGYAIYIAIPIFLYITVKNQHLLVTDSLVMREVARIGELILLGVWGASLSSAMGSLLGAPRTLQALARDGILPGFLGKGYGPGDDPRIATGVAFTIGLIGISAGDLNLIAPVLSMFFLTSYGLLNTAAGFETLIGSPSWRPRFHVRWQLSILGAAGCLATMLMINAGATIIAVLITGLIYYAMKRRKLSASWGDIRSGVLMLIARNVIYKLAEKEPDERTWRPNILVLSGAPTTRWYLIELADALSHGQSLVSVATILPEATTPDERLSGVEVSIQNHLKTNNIPSLVKVLRAENPLEGARTLIDNYGFGPIQPNTILIGETEKEENVPDFARIIRQVHGARKNLVIVREGPSPLSENREMPIHVWWGRQRNNAGFMLAMAYLLQTSAEWNRSRMILNTIVAEDENREEAHRMLTNLIVKGRIEAEVRVHTAKRAGWFQTIRDASEGAGITFMGMRPPLEDETTEAYADYYRTLIRNTEDYPLTCLVLASEEVEFRRIFE